MEFTERLRNDNGVADSCDLFSGTSGDCDSNETPDECESDCNRNEIVDACDIAAGTSEDCNADATPDECTSAAWAYGFGFPGLSGVVFAQVIFDDGTGPALFVGGGFTTASAGAVTVNGIAKWDGFRWTTLESGMGGTVYALAVFDDGSGAALYAGGTFTSAGGTLANYVAKWDGYSWFPLGAGMGNYVKALAVFDDGNGPALYAGGDFNTAGGVTVKHVAKWNPGTQTWSALGTSPNVGVDDDVWSLFVFDPPGAEGPALYVGGFFMNAGGISASRLAKWNGSAWSAVGGGTSGAVYAMTEFDPPGAAGPGLYVGGSFGMAGGNPAVGIARWDGTAWFALGSGANNTVRALQVFDPAGIQQGPSLYAGGDFTNRVAKWDGSGWSEVPGGTTDSVRALAVFDPPGLQFGPALYVGGSFGSAGGRTVQRIARWDGAAWSALGQGLSGLDVWAIAQFDDGSGPAVFVGGDFVLAGGVIANRVSKWNGTTSSALGTGMSGCSGTGCSPEVFALAAFDPPGAASPGLYASGNFTSAGGVAVNHIARWDGTAWSALASGTSSVAQCLIVFDPPGPEEAGLYAGGAFASAGGAPGTVRIAKWDGTAWSGLAGGMSGGSGGVQAIAVFDDGEGEALYAGGSFTVAGGVAANYIAKWDGSTWAPLGDGLDSSIFALAVFDPPGEPGPGLYAAGPFLEAGGLPADRIARWDGSTWSPLGEGTNSAIYALAAFDDALYAAGVFTTAGSVTANRIAKWDGSSWSPVTTGTDGYIHVLAALAVPGNEALSGLFVGGEFASAGGVPSWHIAKWGRRFSDCNGNGVLDDCDLDCNANSVPDECETASATFMAAVSRKNHTGKPDQDIAINLAGHVGQGGVTSESRQGGITELRLTFDLAPGGPCGVGPDPVTIFEQSCSPCLCNPPGQQANYAESGITPINVELIGPELVLSFSPGLSNLKTYRVELAAGVTSLAGQSVEIRSLVGDVDGNGRVDPVDRSLVVGAWSGPGGYSISTDLDLSGATNAVDRAIVVGAWTSPNNCAP